MSAMPGADARSEVSDFYDGRCVLVTGGTGFVGKVLVEKLARSCPGLARVYVLVRPRAARDADQRLGDMLRGPLFQRLREERPQALHKIVALKGDMTQPELGMSPQDRRLVEERVSVVFHTAATVKLDEEMRRSVRINVQGTRRLLRLCERGCVEVFVHVSTAYCNCNRREVREEVYPTVWDPERVIAWSEREPAGEEEQREQGAGDEAGRRDGLARAITHDLPNNYTFTKALAESLLLSRWGDMRLVIVRPSIVVASAREPFPGWVDNWNGPTGILAAAGKGLFRTILCHQEKVADLVPVDMVANLMICSAWNASDPSSEGLKVYNCCTGESNPITWKRFIDLSFRVLKENPFGHEFWYPTATCNANSFMNLVCSVLMHSVPAALVDAACWLTGRTPKMMKLHRKLERLSKTQQHFVTQEWSFPDANVRHLSDLLSERDRQLYPFDVRQIDWPSFIHGYVLGIRQYIFQEPASSLPAARRHIVRLFWLHRALQVLFVLLTCRVLFGYPKFIRTA